MARFAIRTELDAKDTFLSQGQPVHVSVQNDGQLAGKTFVHHGLCLTAPFLFIYREDGAHRGFFIQPDQQIHDDRGSAFAV